MSDISQKLEALRGLEASLDEHRRGNVCARDDGPRRYAFGRLTRLLRPLNRLRHLKLPSRVRVPARVAWLWPHVRRTVMIAGGVLAVLAIGVGALWWRLSSGPIALDIATPWITAAIEQNFGSRHKVEVGGTVIERDEQGRTAVRIRDIVVREPDGKVVASAPRAEVGLSQFEPADRPAAGRKPQPGRRRNFGAHQQRWPVHACWRTMRRRAPRATVIPATPTAVVRDHLAAVPKSFLRDSPKNFAALLAWIDSLRALGLDGYDLEEIGLKNGRVVVDDQRNGQRSVFEHISLSITRPHAGEVVFSIGSDAHERPWVLLAGVKALGEGRRAVSIEARKIALRDVLLAMRIGDGQIDADIPVSADIARRDREGRNAAYGRGGPHGRRTRPYCRTGDGDSRVTVDHAEITFDWDGARRQLSIPFQVVVGGNRFTRHCAGRGARARPAACGRLRCPAGRS